MKKIMVVASLLLLGFGCTPEQRLTDGINSTEDSQSVTVTKDVENIQAPNSEVKIPETTPTKLAVSRSFTIDEIEAGGGLKNWFRDLARANVAGKKTLVRVAVNHVKGFGCMVPTKYCVSTITGGCYGPFVDLKGNSSVIAAAPGTLWEVEGYVVAANQLPEAKDDGTPGTCADGELAYDFEVTRVVQKIPNGAAEDFRFYEYK